VAEGHLKVVGAAGVATRLALAVNGAFAAWEGSGVAVNSGWVVGTGKGLANGVATGLALALNGVFAA